MYWGSCLGTLRAWEEEEEEPEDSSRAVGTAGSSWSSKKEHRPMGMEFGRSQGVFPCNMLNIE